MRWILIRKRLIKQAKVTSRLGRWMNWFRETLPSVTEWVGGSKTVVFGVTSLCNDPILAIILTMCYYSTLLYKEFMQYLFAILQTVCAKLTKWTDRKSNRQLGKNCPIHPSKWNRWENPKFFKCKPLKCKPLRMRWPLSLFSLISQTVRTLIENPALSWVLDFYMVS